MKHKINLFIFLLLFNCHYLTINSTKALAVAPLESRHLVFKEKLFSPDHQSVFALFYDYPDSGDPSWHVFKFEKSVDLKKFRIPIDYAENSGQSGGQVNGQCIMWNWSEAGDHVTKPKIIIIDNYLVFMRGGLYHGLYDIKKDKTIITYDSPWHTFHNDYYKKHKDNKNLDRYELMPVFYEWKVKNIHNPIKEIIGK